MAFYRALFVACLFLVGSFVSVSFAQDAQDITPLGEAGTFAGLLVVHEAFEAGASVEMAADLFALTQGVESRSDEESATNTLVDAITKVAAANGVDVSSLNLVSYDSERGVKFDLKTGLALLKKAVIVGGTAMMKNGVAAKIKGGVAAIAGGATAAAVAKKAKKDKFLATSTSTMGPSTEASSTVAVSRPSTSTESPSTSSSSPSTSTEAPTTSSTTFGGE